MKIKNIFKSQEEKVLEEIKKNGSLNKLKKEQQDKDLKIIYKVFEKFILHFANFSFDISNAIDIIVDTSTKYNIPSEKINYFVTQINTSIFSVKSRLFYLLFDNSNKNKVDTLLKKSDSKISILLTSSLYLNTEHYPKILLLNKTIYKTFQKMIFKKMLMENKNLTMNSRMEIWKSMLNLVTIKNNKIKSILRAKFTYKKIIEGKNIELNLPHSCKEIIELDCLRTHFSENKENKQKVIYYNKYFRLLQEF